MNLQNLRAKIENLNNEGGIPFMEGRKHGGKLPEDDVVSVDNFGFINGEDGEYCVVSLEEYPDFFFFGGSVVTAKFKELQELLDDNGVDLEKQDSGVPVKFARKKNKSGKKEYTTCTFFPEEV